MGNKMSNQLQAEVLHTLMESNDLETRLVYAEEPGIDSDVVELGEWAYVEVRPDTMNVWLMDQNLKFKLAHQLDSYQAVIDVFHSPDSFGL